MRQKILRDHLRKRNIPILLWMENEVDNLQDSLVLAYLLSILHSDDLAINLNALLSELLSNSGKVLPVVITYYTDKSFDFVIKTPPAAVQLISLHI